MALLDIKHYPDEVLLTMGEPVTSFNAELERLAEDMFETMKKAGGVGLAAPQVGISKRLFVMDVPVKESSESIREVIINPEILRIEGEQVGEEGCLSFPGLSQVVKREMRMIARGQNLRGEEIEIDVEELAARCVLHETDHCDGIVFLDRMSPLKRQLAKRKIERLKKTGKWQ